MSMRRDDVYIPSKQVSITKHPLPSQFTQALYTFDRMWKTDV